ELGARLFCAFSELDQRLPKGIAVLVLICFRREVHPLLPVLHVPGAVTNDDPDAGQFEVGEATKGVLLVGANSVASDHGRPLHNSTRASFARVRFIMLESEPSGRRTRYMPGHLGSGTMRGSKTGFLGEARPVFSGLETIVLSREISAWPTVDSTWAHPRSFFAFCPTFEAFRRRRLRLASCAAYRHTSEQ